MIRQLILLPCTMLASLWGKVFSGRVSLLWQDMRNNCYAAYVRHKFNGAEGLIVNGTPLHVIGGRFIHVGRNVTIGFGTRLEAVYQWENCKQTFTPELTLGDNVVLAPLCRIGCINRVEIGAWTTMGQRVYITDHTHGDVSKEQLDLPPRHRPLVSKGPVRIGTHVHIGEGCCIMPGVSIGSHSVIGAGSVVTKDIPPYSVAAGNPARILKQL